MSELNKEKVVDYLSQLPVIELAGLIKELEEKWGVSAAAPVAVATGGAAAAPEGGADKTDFDVVLKSFGSKKIAIIKLVTQHVDGLNLKTAKEFVEGLPKPLKTKVPKDKAEELKKLFEAEGAEVELK